MQTIKADPSIPADLILEDRVSEAVDIGRDALLLGSTSIAGLWITHVFAKYFPMDRYTLVTLKPE